MAIKIINSAYYCIINVIELPVKDIESEMYTKKIFVIF